MEVLFLDEECQLLQEIEPHMKRMRWEEEHWDQQIHLYREREQLKWNTNNQKIVERIWRTSFPNSTRKSPYVHILDLHECGFIRPHVDESRKIILKNKMENAKKMVRKAAKLQQHQIMKILQPTLDERLKNIGPTCSSAADIGEGALDGFPDAYLLQLHPELSRWGFDEELKQRELTATAARFFIIRARIHHSPSCPCSSSSDTSTTVRPVAYAHFR
uniref:Uncharacterized protein n=1 Tax=Meloidogyne javanica TaxID=6303 RepID=A0A915MQN7_MELJA